MFFLFTFYSLSLTRKESVLKVFPIWMWCKTQLKSSVAISGSQAVSALSLSCSASAGSLGTVCGLGKGITPHNFQKFLKELQGFFPLAYIGLCFYLLCVTRLRNTQALSHLVVKALPILATLYLIPKPYYFPTSQNACSALVRMPSLPPSNILCPE